jgi:hypothetical protein
MGFEVERRLEGQKSARLSSRPLVDGWLADLTSSQRVLLCGKADSKRMGMVVAKLIKWSLFTFEASSHPYVMRSSDDEGGGLLADGQT